MGGDRAVGPGGLIIDNDRDFDPLESPWRSRSSGDDSAADLAQSLAAWFVESEDGNAAAGRRSMKRAESSTSCRKCPLHDSSNPAWQRIVDLLLRYRSMGDLAWQASSTMQTSHVAAIIVSHTGHVLDSDPRGDALLRTGDMFCLAEGRLLSANPALQARLHDAMRKTATTGGTSHLLLWAADAAHRRYSLTLTLMRNWNFKQTFNGVEARPAILCLAAPLDRRRIATARQLMDLFGLSAAEARLARALANGDSVEEYARDHDLRLPTVRTQLSAVFHKTGTERQASLVRLITAIPVVRDPA